MRAAWEQHVNTWLQWLNNGVEPGYELTLERTCLETVAALFEHEKANTLANSSAQRDHGACPCGQLLVMAVPDQE